MNIREGSYLIFFLDAKRISRTAVNIEMKRNEKFNFEGPLSWDEGGKYILWYKFN